MEIATGATSVRISCVCGHDYTSPQVVNTGTRPSEEAAERSRSRAFRAAGLVKNFGGFALGISLLGILFFPIALIGAAVGIYTLTMIRGPLGRYSGRRAAALAVAIGSIVFLVEGALAANWLKNRRQQALLAIQASVSEDLRALLRAERLFRATHDTYGTFTEFRFRPPSGRYTVYLGTEDLVAASREGEQITDPLPDEYAPVVTEDSFTAYAVANIDADPFLDVWLLNDHGAILHLADDANNEVRPVDEEDGGETAAGALEQQEDDEVEPEGEEVPDDAAEPTSPLPSSSPATATEPSRPPAPPTVRPLPAAAQEAAPKPAVAPQPAPDPATAPQPVPDPAAAPQPVPDPAAAPAPAPGPAGGTATEESSGGLTIDDLIEDAPD
jgi:hypothetical protein